MKTLRERQEDFINECTIALNPNTKKAKSYIEAHSNSCYYGIDQCYKDASGAKHCAERNIWEKSFGLNGVGYRILSYNTSRFTAGWKLFILDENTGEILKGYLIIETAVHRYSILTMKGGE